MDLNDLFLSCRRGDIPRVKYLVEQKEIEVNVRDKWDSTPLYYACLCGHYELVEYLLKNGARCEANTFDGERCLYGAHTTEIRNMLRNYKVITAQCMRRDDYEEFLRRLLESTDFSDVTFVVHGEELRAHRCVLSARSDYFYEMFETKWKNRPSITIGHELVPPTAFKAVLQYLYTGRLEIPKHFAQDCIRLAKQCKLPSLIQQLEDTVKRVYSFVCTKPGTNVTMILVEPQTGRMDLQQDFGVFAEQGMPAQFCSWVGGSELPFNPSSERTCFVDLCFSVDGLHFFCHKAFMCSRSDYFKAVLRDHFHETGMDLERDVPVVTLRNVQAGVFAQIIYYIYQNVAELTVSNVYEILTAADMYLLAGLKRQCAIFLGQKLDTTNVVGILQTAQVYELPRLEDQCAEFIAKHLEDVVEDPDFHQLILDDAKKVVNRQETDSISIIDDVRYHITGNVQTYSALEEANEKLHLIDELLDTLGLDA